MIGLGHARLSILDLSGGRQPISNENDRIWITFNGEIFNYLELRQDLERRGHQFKTQTDTEVILHLFEEDGERCVDKLNGQWAFAIWNADTRTLFLSRDRMGVRPLFYVSTPDFFAFGSEIKALFSHAQVRREIDLVGLDQVFTFWCTIPPRTVFKGILQLPPGHSMTVQKGAINTYPYWNPSHSDIDYGRSERECAEELRELLIDATRLRLRADVPVGAYLSGGLDSTVITAIVRGFSDNALRTFSVAFDDKEFDEAAFQHEAVRYLNTDHRQILCTQADIGRSFPRVVWHTESPILRTAPAPLFMLSRLVRESGLKVVLTGEGSDEILGGYDIYKEAKVRRFWARFPDSKTRPLLLKRLYPYLPNLQMQSRSYLKAFFNVTPADLADPFFSHLPRWDLTARLKGFFSSEVKARLGSHDALLDLRNGLDAGYFNWDSFSQAQYLETKFLLPGYILSSQGDRMAMAHSVEGRFPFLDHRVVELASRMPPQLKMKVLNEKYILKKAMGDLIPESIRQRPKQPYRAPESQSFFDGNKARQVYVEEMLSEGKIKEFGLFNSKAVGLLAKKIKNGLAIGVKDNMALVGILSTQLLVHQFIHRGGGGTYAAES